LQIIYICVYIPSGLLNKLRRRTVAKRFIMDLVL
jgi:hypothetical protein